MVALSDRHAEFAALSCEVLLLSCDSKYTLQAWAKTAKEKGGLGEMRLPLVSDFNKRVAEQYGTLLRTGVPTRAFFLISPSGINLFSLQLSLSI